MEILKDLAKLLLVNTQKKQLKDKSICFSLRHPSLFCNWYHFTSRSNVHRYNSGIYYTIISKCMDCTVFQTEDILITSINQNIGLWCYLFSLNQTAEEGYQIYL